MPLGRYKSRFRLRSLLVALGFEVEKRLGRPQFKIVIEKPLNHPWFGGRVAPWLPSIQIKVEKPLGHRNSRMR